METISDIRLVIFSDRNSFVAFYEIVNDCAMSIANAHILTGLPDGRQAQYDRAKSV